MNDLLRVQVEHTNGNFPGPAHHLLGQDLHVQSDVVVQRAPRAILHDDAEARRAGTHPSAGGSYSLIKQKIPQHMQMAQIV